MAASYITTTLPYVNADPHIGFALEIIQADVVARWWRLKGREVFFNTGTDEHGLKIYRNAVDAGLDPLAYCDQNTSKFDRLKSALNVSYTHFIRTTNPTHMAAAQEFWRRCDTRGDIYKKNYRVKYCVGCELEKTDSELYDDRCPVHPNLSIEVIDEENYFFRFSKYQQPLLEWYQAHPDFVIPRFRMNEIVAFVERGLEDFSISRLKSKMPWGVPVPGDDQHVMYVWFDALINYISTCGWPADEHMFRKWWPGVQVAGKDNLRQQSAMWQAMLLSANLPLSQQIFIHGFITSGGQKMSKSLGNVVDPFALVDSFGTDAVRYFLLGQLPAYEDGDFTIDRMMQAYHTYLANDLGNLVQRVLSMAQRFLDGAVVRVSPLNRLDAVDAYLEQYQFDRALSEIWSEVSWANRFIDEKKPWAMAKQGNEEGVRETLEALVASLAQIADYLVPFMPDTADRIQTLLMNDRLEPPHIPLFPRKEAQ